MGCCWYSDSVEKLVYFYFNSNLTFTFSVKEIEHFTWNEQEAFLNATLNSELLKKYPVSKEFTRLFLKKVIGILEPVQEVHDDLYKYLCSAMKGAIDTHFHYKHYIIANNLNNIITMKETKNLVVNGTTGLKTWQAAIMLSDWAISNRREFENNNILELGSGVGFTGVTIAKLCDIKSYTFTDCHDDVLQTISANIEINFPDIPREDADNKTVFKDHVKTLEVSKLDWNELSLLPADLVPDVLIGADIIYDPTIIKPLCNVLKLFLERNKNLQIYFINIMRNEDTFRQFLNTLDSINLTYENITLSHCVNINWDNNIHKYFFKIFNKS